MTVSIVGCGESAQGWFNTPCDLSIGVNDCYKFGVHPNQLVLINFERKFLPNRLKTIIATRPNKVWIHTQTWKRHFSNAEVIKLSPFNGYVRKGLIYSSKTSPMVALSLAVKQGATEIILWGVDMVNHASYRKGTKNGDFEIKQYQRFFDQLHKQGIKVYRGAVGTCFENLALYEKKMNCVICDGMAIHQTEERIIVYKNQDRKVLTHFYKCEKCGEQFTTDELDTITINQVYQE